MYQFLPNTITNQTSSFTTSKWVASLVKGIADVVLIFDQEYKVIYANQKAGELLDTTPENIIGSDIYRFFPGRQHEFLQALLQETMEQEQVYNRSTLFEYEGQKNIPVSISFSTLTVDDELEGYMLVAKDNRQLTQVTDALKQKNEQLARLFYRISHDLEGPVASIQGMLELAKMEPSDSDATTYLTYIQSSTDKLKRTLRGLGLLQHERSQEITTSEVSLRELLEEVVEKQNDYPGRDDVLIHLTANPKLSTVTSEHMLSSVLQSIIENSIKFRKTNTNDTVIKISARNHKDGIKIKVKDNGLGMDKTMQQRACDMFYRGHGHTQGSGLGLFIAKNAIEKLGGEIKVKARPFLGTEVSIYLPFRSATAMIQ